MTTQLQRRLGFLAGLLSVLLLAARPVSASGADNPAADAKTNPAVASVDLSALQGQISNLSAKLDGNSNALRAELTALKDARQAPAPVSEANQHHPAEPGWPEFTLLGLGGASVLLLLILLLTIGRKLGAGQRTMVETRDAMARLGVQMENRVKAMEGSSADFNAAATKVSNFVSQVESSVNAQLEILAKKINSSQLSELVEATAMSKTEAGRLRAETAALQKFMGETRQHVTQFLEDVSKKSSQIIVETKAATQQSLHETQRETKQFMEELQQTTRKWIADFERQTNNSLGKIEAESHSLDKLFWPEPFLGEGKLCIEREKIRARANAGDTVAFALMLGLGEFQLCLANRGGDHSRTVESLDRLGQLAYRYWKGEPDASVETVFESAQTLGGEINKILTANNVPLSLRIIMPRATFDMGTMLSEKSLTGSTTRVHEPLSWTVIQRSGDNHKVLVTGKVITE